MHEHGIVTIAVIAGAALAMGIVFSRLRQPVIAGYILAGVLLGPTGFSLTVDRAMISEIAELGVIMLLFMIGLELSLRSFRRIWRMALTAAAMQIGLALVVTQVLAMAVGWDFEFALIVGFGLSLSSTAVAIKILEEVGELLTPVGRTTMGVLIAQDLAVVPMLLIVESLGQESISTVSLVGPVIIAVSLLAVVVVLLSRSKREHLPYTEWISDDADLASMVGFGLCFVGAALSGVMGLSPAYGAFVVGLVVGNSLERHKIMAATRPIQSILLMVFFVSIGLLLDLNFIWENLALVCGLLVMVILMKTVANVLILKALGEDWPCANLAGSAMGQVGEFSFLLVAAGVSAGLVGGFGSQLMISVIALSLTLSPFWLFTARRMEAVAWRHVRGFGDLLGRIYGRRTGTVIIETQSAAAATMRMTLSLGGAGGSRLQKWIAGWTGRKPAEQDGDDMQADDVKEDANDLPAITHNSDTDAAKDDPKNA